MPRFFFAPARLGVTVAVAAMLSAGSPRAETLDLRFAPPAVDLDPMCVARPPDEETVEYWSSWDGLSIPDRSPPEIRRDIHRLMSIDADLWYDTAVDMISFLEEAEPQFKGQNGLLMRISVMQSAGRFDTLVQDQLVAKLAAFGDALSPRSMTVLSRLYRDGIGTSRNTETADALLISAGYAGNPDALLELSELALSGRELSGWDVPPELAITTAFGTLVGELNATICDRTIRIAREYHNGTVVTQNRQLAHDWYRFTADLGDAFAAWKVVEYHLEAEGFEKDNGTLLTYLTQASDAGLPYAQIELGRLYERGALVPQDLDRALELFLAAAAGGERPGMTRVALFLERHQDVFPELAGLRLDMLRRLSELSDPPGWAFSRLADAILEDKGRWAGAAEARPLLEQAVAFEDPDGIARLAEHLLHDVDDPASFDRAINLLSRSVATKGTITSLKTLYSAYICQAPNAPLVDEANYWIAAEESAAATSLDITAQEIMSLDHDTNPFEIATLQSYALYGRPKPLAAWLVLLEEGGFADDTMRAFWSEYSNQYDLVVGALAKLQLELAEDSERREMALNLLRSESDRIGPEAVVTLSKGLIGTSATAEAYDLLRNSAQAGLGQAMVLLAGLAEDDAGRRAIYHTFEDIIDANGDFTAQLFALPYVSDEERAKLFGRAIAAMPCDYKSVQTLIDTLADFGHLDEAKRWLDVAGVLSGENAWAMTDLGRRWLALGGDTATIKAAEHFSAATQLGDKVASLELFALRLRADAPTYDPDIAADMLASARPDILPSLLSRWRRATPDVKAEIETRIDMADIQRLAAEKGDIFAMRGYGQHLRETADGAAQLAESTEWLSRAAEGGDTVAMAEYGEALAFGIGVTPNPEAARLWLSRAADQGNEKAGEITRLLNLTSGG